MGADLSDHPHHEEGYGQPTHRARRRRDTSPRKRTRALDRGPTTMDTMNASSARNAYREQSRLRLMRTWAQAWEV